MIMVQYLIYSARNVQDILSLVWYLKKFATVGYCNAVEVYQIKSVVEIIIGVVFVVLDVFIVIVVYAFVIDFVSVVLVFIDIVDVIGDL